MQVPDHIDNNGAISDDLSHDLLNTAVLAAANCFMPGMPQADAVLMTLRGLNLAALNGKVYQVTHSSLLYLTVPAAPPTMLCRWLVPTRLMVSMLWLMGMMNVSKNI
jgi:hypothetical protein